MKKHMLFVFRQNLVVLYINVLKYYIEQNENYMKEHLAGLSTKMLTYFGLLLPIISMISFITTRHPKKFNTG